jgi:hypothetical protein
MPHNHQTHFSNTHILIRMNLNVSTNFFILALAVLQGSVQGKTQTQVFNC